MVAVSSAPCAYQDVYIAKLIIMYIEGVVKTVIHYHH